MSKDERDRVGIVVQRWAHDIAGGAENLAGHYADLLREKYRVDLITTTARETDTWANELEAGTSEENGMRVLRFAVGSGRTRYFHKLNNLLNARYRAFRAEPVSPRRSHASFFDPDSKVRTIDSPGEPIFNWSTALQEEWIRSQGPHSPDLLTYLEQHQQDYRGILFLTYLYSPTYFGTFVVDRARTFLVPTLHDEPPAYLPAYRRMAERSRFILWLTPGEQAVGRRLWGDLPGRIASYGIDTGTETGAETEKDRIDVSPANEPTSSHIAPFLRKDSPPFIYYCGRIDAGKGCAELVEFFRRFRDSRAQGAKLSLVLTGSVSMELPRDPDIIYGGFVTEEEKFRLMNACSVFVMPSPHESLSIVTLEAMAREKPVLVNGHSTVLLDHIGDGLRGRAYRDAHEFSSELERILEDGKLRKSMGGQAREYVLENYDRDVVRRRLIEEIEKTDPI